MKGTRTYNPLVYVWIGLVLIFVLPKLGLNLMLSLHMGPETPLLEKMAYVVLIIGGAAYAIGHILLVLKHKAGVWMIFFSLPVAYALARLVLAMGGSPASDKGGVMFFFYVIIPLLLNLLTAAILFLKKGGCSGWLLLRGKEDGATAPPAK